MTHLVVRFVLEVQLLLVILCHQGALAVLILPGSLGDPEVRLIQEAPFHQEIQGLQNYLEGPAIRADLDCRPGLGSRQVQGLRGLRSVQLGPGILVDLEISIVS